MAETPATGDQAADYLKTIERIQVAIGAVLREHAPSVGWPCCVHAVVETAGTLAALLIRQDPAARALLVNRLDELRLFIATAGQPTQ